MSFFGDVLKKEQESLDRKEKDFAPWSFKLTAEPKKGLKITHTHKVEGAKPISSSKIELPTMPYPYFENVKGSYEFDLEKFVKSVSTDIYAANGNKVNVGLKWTWTPSADKHVVNFCKKSSSQDLGGFTAHVQNEVDVTKVGEGAMTHEHKHSFVLDGGDWKFGGNGDFLAKSTKFGMKATYATPCKNVLLWLKGEAESPVGKVNNSVSLGCSMKMCGWQHLSQVNYHMPNGDAAFKGVNDMPVSLQGGHNFKASNSTDLQASYTLGHNLVVHNVLNHKLNDNLSAKLHQHYFGANVGGDKKAVDVGVEFSYTL